jgi:hypothetical protein
VTTAANGKGARGSGARRASSRPGGGFALWWASLVLFGVACSVDNRALESIEGRNDPANPTGDAGPGGSGATRRPGESGAACAGAGECTSGFCVDGLCCESACDGVCQQCSESGRCDVMPVDDVACMAVTCPVSTECATFPESLIADRCSALGVCKTSEDCAATQTSTGALCQNPDITGTEARCDESGACADARREDGESCALGPECRSGFCVDGVCCQEACEGECEVCAGPAGACGGIEAGDPLGACGEAGRSCFGRGACLLPLGSECSGAADCGSGACVTAAFDVAGQLCCEQQCAEGQRCSGDGRCVDPVADLGQACAAPGDCALGNCVDGVCCDSGCQGVCERCNAPGEAGRCVADPPETACDASDSERRCLSRGRCQLPNGSGCQFGEDCGSGRCEPALGGGSVCCAETCERGNEACDPGSALCQVVPRGNGNACTTGAQCASGSCQGGRCCPADCGGQCEVCSLLGQCEIPARGAEGCNPINCTALSSQCRSYGEIGNLCEAVGDCKEQADCPFTNAAFGASCTLPNGGGAGRCDGSGACESIPLIEQCANLPLPAPVELVAPMRGAYTGSLSAPAANATLRPTLVWTASSTRCGALRYEVQMDNSCSPGALGTCAFSSAEINTSTTQATFQPAADLAVVRQAPVGALYAWRVRACDGADRCSSFSAPGYLHVGRTSHDLNGDGFADVLVRTGLSQAGGEPIDVYLGSATFDPQADSRITTGSSYSVRHAGDINGDGFGDLATIGANFQECGSDGGYPRVVFGGTNLAAMRSQNLCAAAGSPSVTFQTGFVGDLDGDGFAEVGFTREFQDSRFVIFRGGTSVAGSAEVDVDVTIAGAAGTYPHILGDRTFDGGGDFNRDGFADVIVSGRGISPALLRTRLFRGAATLPRSMATSFDFTVDSPESNSPLVTRIGDINQDGRDDWALGIGIGTSNAGRVALLNGAGGLPTQFSSVVSVTSPLIGLSRLIDFDRNGVGEVFVAATGPLQLLRNTGGLTPTPDSSQLNASARLSSGDNNGDGRDDLLLNSTGTGTFTVRWVAAAASFTVTPISLLPFSTSDGAVSRSVVY